MSRVVALVSRAALAGRVALALAIVGHRPWCEDCRAHARLVEGALRGESLADLAERDGGAA